MFSETLEMDRVKTDEKKKEYYSIISNEASRLSKIVNSILNFSKMEAGKRKFIFEGLSLKELSIGKLESAAINPNQEFTGNPITDIILLLVYGVSYILQLALAAVNGIVYAVTLIIQTLVSIIVNFPQFLANLIAFSVDFLIALSTFVINVILTAIDISADLLYYLIPLIISVIFFIIDDLTLEV